MPDLPALAPAVHRDVLPRPRGWDSHNDKVSCLRIVGSKSCIFPTVDGLIISIFNRLAHVLKDHGDMPRKDSSGRWGHKSELNFGVSSQQ